jgi:hypothetical protein
MPDNSLPNMMIHSKMNNHLSLIIWFGALYICRAPSTDVMSALQIHLFRQNKPNFRKSQVNVTDLLKRNYEQMDTWSIRKKQSQTNPNKAKTNPILANKTPERTQFKPKQTQLSPTHNSQIYPISHQRTMNNEQRTNIKQTQFKPNLSCRSLWRSRNKPNFGGKYMLLIKAPLEVVAITIITGYYLEPIRP